MRKNYIKEFGLQVHNKRGLASYNKRITLQGLIEEGIGWLIEEGVG